MIFDVTDEIEQILTPIALYSKDYIQIYHYKNWTKRDQFIRKQRFFHSKAKFNENGFVNFKVKKYCSCAWQTVYGTFEFEYEVYYLRKEKLYQVYFQACIFR